MHKVSSDSIKARFSRSVISNYGRFPLVVREARGVELVDFEGRRYLDMGGGIAVNCLGHGHPELREALANQMSQLDHISNLYYFEEQVRVAEEIIQRIGIGKCFFCNSGAEANEAIIKLARKFGDPSGRYDIITTDNSFHGRTLATIAATGQEKVRKGFGPLFPGFSQVPYNNLEAMTEAVTRSTIAILVEGVQGEGGLTPADADYLRGIRKLCDANDMLFLMDGVQCGHFRTGRFQSIQRILALDDSGNSPWLPDAISLGKSLGGGFPMGGIWAGQRAMDVLTPGSHGTTYGGNPLACSMALKIIEIIQRDNLTQNILELEEILVRGLKAIQAKFPEAIQAVRGLGFMNGLVLNDKAPIFQSDSERTAAMQVCSAAQDAGLILIPAGPRVVRFLPAYNIRSAHLEEAFSLLTRAFHVLQDAHSGRSKSHV